MDKNDFLKFPREKQADIINMINKNILYYFGKYNICATHANKIPNNHMENFGEFQLDAFMIYTWCKSYSYNALIKQLRSLNMHFLKYFGIIPEDYQIE